MSNDYLDSIKRIRNRIIGNAVRVSNFVDCCKEFRFIRAFDTINFNNKMNRLGIVHLVNDENYNFTEILEDEIIEPIIHHSSNTFGITGKTGSGKSEFAETLVLICVKTNKDFLGRDVNFYLCYTWEDFHDTLKILKKGDILWKDEMPKTMGKGSRLQKWEIENILHSVRKMENTFIFIDPVSIDVDLCDLYIESAGMNFKTKTNRFMLRNEKKQYFGHIYVKLHNNERLRDWYETQKDKFIRKILDLAGKVKVEEVKENKDNSDINPDQEIERKLSKDHNFLKFEIRMCLEWKNSIKKPSERKLAIKYYGTEKKRGTVRNRLKILKEIMNDEI